MIYTVTLNPAVDYYISLKEFQEGKLNKIDNGYTLAGGKGINVSKVLKNCGISSVALGFVGGFTGEYIKRDLKNYGIDENFVILKEDTRINIKLKSEKCESEIAGQSPLVDKNSYDEFLEKVKEIKEEDILVLSGSVPPSVKDRVYAEIIEMIPKGVKVVLDARGVAFKYALEKGVFLVKPNHVELKEFFNEKYETVEELIVAGEKLRKLGSENVIISLGKDGSILITPNGSYIGNVPKGKLISSVGAGDSMVAGTLYGLCNGMPIEEAYRYGICAGSATAFKSGLAELKDIKKLYDDVVVKKEEGNYVK